MPKAIFAALLATLSLAATAAAGFGQDKFLNVVANLSTKAEVPAPHNVPAGAGGLFSARADARADGGAKLTWRLTYANLTGRATGAHIHLGKLGKAGPVTAALCGPCTTGQRGTVVLKPAAWKAVLTGGAYVNLHTAKHAAGEIRGQLRLTKTQPASG
jgi:hypothetical protein